MKKFVMIAAVLGSFALTACDVTRPVVVVGDGSIFRGTATASLLDGGWFQATNGQITCQGRYTRAPGPKTVTFPVNCSNGLSGIGTATYSNPNEGGGTVRMQDGSTWQFLFGQRALDV